MSQFFISTDFYDHQAIPYSKILEDIDNKIYQYAGYLLDNIRYGFNTNVNFDAYEDLTIYREILTAKLYCDYCLCDISIDQIIAKIKNLTNSIC